MANKIVLKKSSVASKVPLSTDLEVGEIAVNLTDQKLYSKKSDGTVILVGSGVSGGGDVVGPASATDNAIARFDSTTGKLIQNSTVTIDDNGTLANVNAISLDTTPTTPPTTAGTIYWDEGNGTPSVVLNASTELQLGQENIAKVYNGSGATIPNGAVVAVNGAQGQRPRVTLADADSEALSAPTLGIATESIANGAEGFICTFGLVRGVDTSGFTAGLPIYLSQTAGQFTQTRPSAPAHTVALGWVIKVNASSGEVFVNINNGWELDELHNVLITSPTSGNTLIYDATTGVWENANITAGTGISVTNGAGSITVNNTGVTSVSGTGTVNGLTLSGTVTTTGSLTLGGTLSGIANSALTNSSVTVNGTSIALGASGTITANNPNALTINNGGAGAASGTTYNGSSAITISYNTVGAPSTTGTNASGTWGISISGNAATATSAGFITNTNIGKTGSQGFISTTSWNTQTWADQPISGLGMTIAGTPGAPNSNFGFFNKFGNRDAGGPGWGGMWMDYDGSNLYYGATTVSTSYAGWKRILDSGNYSSYAFPITGGSLTTGATNNLFIGRNSTATAYNSISLNGNPADSSNMGLTGGGGSDTTLYINAPGQISLRTNSFGQTTTITADGLQNNNSLRAPIFYDSNNTVYYLDPNGSSYLRGLINVAAGHGNTNIRLTALGSELGSGVTSTMQWWVSEPNVTWNEGGFGYNVANDGGSPNGFGRLNTSLGQAYTRYSTTGAMYFYCTNTGGTRYQVMTLDPGNYVSIDAGNSIRAPYFADKDNTSYYCNPAGQSVFAELRLNTNVWNTSSDGNNRFYFENASSTYIRGITGSWYIQLGSTSTTTTILEGSGNFYTTGAVTAYWSDKRLKKNIEKINDWREILSKINGYRFEWNDLGLKILGDSYEQELGVKVGVLAQEAKEALPQSAVVQLMQYENKVDGVLIPKKDIGYDPENPYLTVQLEKYIPVLIEASKGLMDENEQLKATIQSLVGRIAALEQKGI